MRISQVSRKIAQLNKWNYSISKCFVRQNYWVIPPELAVASVAAEGCCAAAEGDGSFNYRL